jgi:hypothetical protein
MRDESNVILVQLGPHLQAIVPGHLQGEKQKLTIGGTLRGRIVKIDLARSSVILTTKPLLRHTIKSYDELSIG